MPDGVHLMIPASEYAEMEAKIERLEKALDKACGQLAWGYDIQEYYDEKNKWDEPTWKEWCMKDD